MHLDPGEDDVLKIQGMEIAEARPLELMLAEALFSGSLRKELSTTCGRRLEVSRLFLSERGRKQEA